jgi:hypothetical protein
MVLCWIAYRKVLKVLFLRAGARVFRGQGNELNRKPEASLAELLKRKMPYEPAIAVGTLLSFFAR